MKGLETSRTTYGSWPCGRGGEIRMSLAIRHGEAVLDIRFGEYAANGRWVPGSRGVMFRVTELSSLLLAVRRAIEDAKRMDLDKSQDDGKRRAPRMRRWSGR
jgi:hypothetical protein